MNDQPSSITILFHDSENYRRLISIANRNQKNHGEEYELTFGTSSVFLRRTSNPKEIMLYTQTSWTSLLFGTMLLIDPKQVLLTDFHIASVRDPFTLEFLRCIQECAIACADCFTTTDDPEKFHRFRLSLRAYRSFLGIARKFGVKEVESLRSRCRLLSKSGNALRDNDVRLTYYAKFEETPVPGLLDENALLRDAALEELVGSASALWFESLRIATQVQAAFPFIKKLKQACRKENKRIVTRWTDLDLRNDDEVHAFRIRLKKHSYALNVLKNQGLATESLIKSVKAVQSRLGDIRDLRRFYVLPGLDCETRYRAVSRLSTLEKEVRTLSIEEWKKSKP